jgi:hypothetical protein
MVVFLFIKYKSIADILYDALIIKCICTLICFKALTKPTLVSQLSLDHLAVEASDVGDGLILRADSLASAGVGAVTEAELVHLGNHVLHTTGSLLTSSLVRYFYLPHDGTYGFKGVSEDLTGDAG